MPPAVLGLLIGAAILHAGWNILLKTAEDPLRTAGRGMLVGAIVLIPAGFAGWLLVDRPPIPTEAWVLAFASGILEAVYFALLSGAYARGDLSLVYPIARGTAPVLSVAVGILFLGERLGPVGALGVGLLLVGILSLQRPWAVLRSGGLPRRTREAAWLAVATGVSIACYSAVDRVGARTVPPVALRLAHLDVHRGLPRRRDRGRRPARSTERRARLRVRRGGRSPGDGGLDGDPGRPRCRRIVGSAAGAGPSIGGLVTVVAYLLVLVAYTFAPLAVVAPVRESAIVLVSGWGSFRLGEAASRRVGLTRLASAAIIVVGAFLLALEG